MSNQTLMTSKITLKGFDLSVTTRSVGDSLQTMEELTFRTISAWFHLTGKIGKGEFELSEQEQGSVESRYTDFMRKTDPEFNLVDAWGDARVTVWAKNADFHLNSDDDFQIAINTYQAHQNALKRAEKAFAPFQQDKAQPAPANEKPAAPKGSQRQTPANNGVYYTKNEAIEKLKLDDSFQMKIAQIACVSDKKGNLQYEFSAKYGGNIGKFPEITLYADNEPAIKSGLIDRLADLGLKLGESKSGEWILNCVVGKPQTKGDKTYGRVYAKSLN